MPLSRNQEKRKKQLANLNRTGRSVFKPRKLKVKISKEEIIGQLSKVDIIEFCERYLNISFEERPAQRVILKVFYGLKLTDQEIDLYKKLTKNREVFEPDIEKIEGIFILGAKAGKSFLVSLIGLFECICRGNYWRQFLNRGEVGYCVIVSVKEKLATQVIQAYCSRIMQYSKISYLVKRSYQNELEFKNGLKILSIPCNSRSALGLSIFLILADEIGHFFVEGAKADIDVFNSLRPRQLGFLRAKTLLISTPAGKQGLLYNLYEQGFKVKDRLTCQGESLLVNPKIDQNFLRKELERDPDFYKMEYKAEFAEKAENYLPFDLIKEIEKFAGDLEYDPEYSYQGSLDQSGLSGKDKIGFAISHKDKDDQVYLDCCRSWRASVSDLDIIMEYIRELTGQYGIRKISIDRFSRGFVEASLNRIGLEAELRPSLAEVYSNFKSLAIMKRVNIPMLKELGQGLLNTQAYFSRSNTLSIGHERTLEGHSDMADASVSSLFFSSKIKTLMRQGRVFTKARGFSSIAQLASQLKGKVFYGGEQKGIEKQEVEKEKLKIKILNRRRGKVYFSNIDK